MILIIYSKQVVIISTYAGGMISGNLLVKLNRERLNLKAFIDI